MNSIARSESSIMPTNVLRIMGSLSVVFLCFGAAQTSAGDQSAPALRSDTKYDLRLLDVGVPEGDGHPIDRLLASYFAKRPSKQQPLISDERFARRVALDVVGLPPTSTQLAEFLADQRPGKRLHFVERLLADRENYVGHWMTFWSDHLRIGSDVDAGAFDNDLSKAPKEWLKKQLDQDVPYDRFVQDLIAGDFFDQYARSVAPPGEVASPVDIPEMQVATTISQVFLGLQLKCASCHDSFVDRWTLKDAWGLASALGDQEFEMHHCQMATGQKASPRFPLVGLGEINPQADKHQRRLRVAEMMTQQQNGLFARTIVNRVWARLFGRGLVEPLDEMMEHEAWHPELLDWLAAELIRRNYDLKQILLLITTSNAYQLPAVIRPQSPKSGEYVFQGPELRRITAEQFVDGLYCLGHSPTDSASPFRLAQRAWQQDNNRLMTMLGRPGRDVVITWREQDMTALVELELMNGPELQRLVQQGSEAQLKQSTDTKELSARIYRTLLGRTPTTKEQLVAERLLNPSPNQETLADLIWTVLMLPEFQLIL
jgi:hypothetical protein